MFNTGKKERVMGEERIDTLIGERTKFEGSLHTSDTTHINGELIGDVISDGMLIIGVSGKVQGNIDSREILVAGTVCGNLRISEKLTIAESGVINGDVETKSLIISEGAVFTGTSKMTSGSDNINSSVVNSIPSVQAAASGKQKVSDVKGSAVGQVMEDEKGTA